ncbi:hypothetical protein [Paraburkholderia antibiotica]|uniref:Uncharacterized protein n=1 Tax=Paraburkholderia antibiotica TaxID=2728839 RepID=A0A7Y0A1Q0_9BURK|nr:hypothetical protein [Paraburkholderia antibiotica]NML34896.1 hypothetical protein [Paraburkholderia antibiotica]
MGDRLRYRDRLRLVDRGGDSGGGGMTQHYDNALHVMEVEGGSFIKALAHCYLMADSINRTKLRKTFAGYFEVYEARFEAWKEQQRKAA